MAFVGFNGSDTNIEKCHEPKYLAAHNFQKIIQVFPYKKKRLFKYFFPS